MVAAGQAGGGMLMASGAAFAYVGQFTGSLASAFWGMILTWTGAGVSYVYA